MKEAWEEEQMSNLGCESVGDLIAEVMQLREENAALKKLIEIQHNEIAKLRGEEE